MELSEPLSEAEFAELDNFLASDAVPKECMDISMLDGFLTALAVGPNPLPPGLWLPEIYAEDDDEAVQWESAAQAQRMSGLILRFLNDIAWQLREEPDAYEPVIYRDEQDGQPIAIIDEWCFGFMAGVELDAEGWAPLLEADAVQQAALMPMLLYGTERGLADLESRPELAAEHDKFVGALPSCVQTIYEFWLPQRRAATTIRREAPKTGRNDPCPCGSGKKFKKCCGDLAKLH